MVNLELYRVFYTVAKCGSLTRAAEELHISQPAVSQSIKQLENQLGTPLFHRTHHGMELSQSGGALIFKDVEDALTKLEHVELRLADLKNTATGTLRIGASESIFQYCLADKIVEFHEKYPDVRLELLTDVSPRTIEQLKNDECDVAFLNLPLPEDDEIEIIESILHLNDVFIAGEAFSQLKGRKVEIEELQELPLLLMENKTMARTSFERFCNGLGVTLQPAVEVDSWGFMKRLVEKGMGIGCIPREYAGHRLKEGSIFVLDVTPPLPSRSVVIALPKNANLSYAVRAFIAMFQK